MLSLYIKKIHKKTKEWVIVLNYKLFGIIPLKIKTENGIRILVYHGICKQNPHKFNSRFITVNEFEKHLILIKKLYHSISVEDFTSSNFSKSQLNILLTFDDGHKNNYELAIPLLKKYNIPAVFFITGCNQLSFPYLFNDVMDIIPSYGPNELKINNEIYVNKKIFGHNRYVNKNGDSLSKLFHCSSFVTRENIIKEILKNIGLEALLKEKEYCELMNSNEIKEISNNSLFTIAPHGFYHTDLSCLPELEINDELRYIKEYVKSLTNKETECIAFPYGNYNQQVIDCCQKFNLKHLFKAENKNSDILNDFIYERFTINPYISDILQMYYIAKNKYN